MTDYWDAIMQMTLNNSNLTLLLPKDYSKVGNGEALYKEMYQGTSLYLWR